ncbi:Eco57I restriction-modification methylase domain-containing protein [Virgibacillus doumboii]|uniref:Eco57I restriction-modification methylase domain-containing protein n=1 Tax=Virgibacillus doumboii TaxID=2697503 RepID=UPI0013DEF23E|nr:N-6 DNA methylase [Virgibacillus doumboii]
MATDLRNVSNIINYYRDRIVKEIVDAQQQKEDINQQAIYDEALRVGIKILTRFILYKAISEKEKRKIDLELLTDIIMGKEPDVNYGILELLPLKQRYKLNANTIHDLYNETKNLQFFLDIDYIVGSLYEKSQNKEIRKALGQYFSDRKYINMILERIPIGCDDKILETSSGGGSFLSESYKHIIKKFNFQDKKKQLEILENNFYGVDIDPFCVNLTKLNLLLTHNELELKNLKIFNQDFLNTEINKKIDVIIGNPPYNATLKKDVKELMKANYQDITMSDNEVTGTLNSAALFIRKSIDILKEGGYLGFIIPNSILRVDSYKKLRQFILNNCSVKSIINIGKAFSDVGLEMVILIVQKGQADEEEPVEILNETTGGNFVKHTLEYKYLFKWNIFPLFLDNSLSRIASKIEKNTIKLRDISIMPRGKSISAKSPLFKTELSSDATEIIHAYRGRDIGQFKTKKPELFINKSYFNETDLRLLDKSEKIMVQNVAKRIVATYDNQGRFALDTVNNLTLLNEFEQVFNYKYVLGIMNSELINFYFQNTINNRSKLTIHMDKPYIGNIPVKNINKQSTLIEVVDCILKLNEILLNEYSPYVFLKNLDSKKSIDDMDNYFNYFNQNRNNIKKSISEKVKEADEIVYFIYEITEQEKNEIKLNLGTNLYVNTVS